MAPLNVIILSNEFVRPSSPTNYPFKKYHLSMLDQLMPSFFVPTVLYYHHQFQTTSIAQLELISSRLRESLSQTLTMFYPFAGRLNRGDNSIDCNDMGVQYLEAKVDSMIMDVIECHETEMVDPLVPNLMGNGEEEDEIFAIQVNYFNCGGIAIGTYVPHKIADGVSFFSFMTSWAAISRQHDNTINILKPSFPSSSLFPRNEKHDYNPLSEVWKETLVTRRFVFDASKITSMRAKAKIDHDHPIITRVEVVSSFIWKYATVDKPGKQYIAFQVVNLRSRMVPPLSEHAIGNMAVLAYAYCSYEDSNDLTVMGRKMREGIQRIDDEYIKRIRGDEGYAVMMKNWMKIEEMSTTEDANIFRFSSWCRFPVYNVDFGMGKPVWASMGSSNLKNYAILLDSKCGDGIEAWVTMNEQDMARFQLAFVRANTSSST
ncbi:stemmadenine O-acetyltransferase-like [Impatiens glandulifera]|uniref:stemmadenine O-acetyltransferase-like n=1 Tax=Impatiens glandulifera TaxID=253017 RepID=UPI001FB16165|nr:stemmadenine O-acetyltransferase-like [Impatiens glandulifera]